MTCIIQKRYLIESDSHPLLQGWDLDRYFPSLSSWDDYYLHTLDDMIGARDLSESSFLSTYSPNVISLPWSHSANYNDLDFGKQVEVEKDINADFNYFPLALTLAPDYLTLAEDCRNGTKCKDSSMFLSPHNLHIMSKVFGERYHHPSLEGFLLCSGLDIELEWDYPSLSGSSRKHHSPINYALQSPRNEGTSSCFLLKRQE